MEGREDESQGGKGGRPRKGGRKANERRVEMREEVQEKPGGGGGGAGGARKGGRKIKFARNIRRGRREVEVGAGRGTERKAEG